MAVAVAAAVAGSSRLGSQAVAVISVVGDAARCCPALLLLLLLFFFLLFLLLWRTYGDQIVLAFFKKLYRRLATMNCGRL